MKDIPVTVKLKQPFQIAEKTIDSVKMRHIPWKNEHLKREIHNLLYPEWNKFVEKTNTERDKVLQKLTPKQFQDLQKSISDMKNDPEHKDIIEQQQDETRKLSLIPVIANSDYPRVAEILFCNGYINFTCDGQEFDKPIPSNLLGDYFDNLEDNELFEILAGWVNTFLSSFFL